MNAVEEFGSFLDEHLPAFRAKYGDSPSFDERREWQRILQTGLWVAPQWDPAHGGRGLDVLTALACSELLIARGAPATAGILGVANVGPTIAIWGTDDQRMHLHAILDGSEIWCQGFSEPGAGSDLAGLQARAELRDDHYVVNGQKIWTSDGVRADYMQLLVRTDPAAPKHRGISALLVDLNTPGVRRRPIRQITGEAEFAEVFFTDVRVPPSALLGPLNEGWQVTMTTLGHERTGGVTHAALVLREVEEAVAAHRIGDGRPGLGPIERDELICRYVEGKVLGTLGERSLASIRATGQPGPEQSIIKLEASLFSQRLAETLTALQGHSVVAGDDVALSNAYLQSRSLTIAGGTTEVMKNIVAQRVLGLPR
jgi:alkylation response protein AidB-like acyl-CoA dehydrogenase